MLFVRDLGIVLVGGLLLRSQGLVIAANRWGKYTTLCMVLTALSYVIETPASLAHRTSHDSSDLGRRLQLELRPARAQTLATNLEALTKRPASAQARASKAVDKASDGGILKNMPTEDNAGHGRRSRATPAECFVRASYGRRSVGLDQAIPAQIGLVEAAAMGVYADHFYHLEPQG